MLGIQPVESDPGYHVFVLAPRPGGSFSFVKGHFDSVYGRIESGWELLDDGAVRYEFTVPANTSAVVDLSVPEDATVTVKEGADYAVAGDKPGHFEIPSGKYTFVVR